MTNITINLIDETLKIFRTVRASMVMAMQKLYEVHSTDAWKGRYSSFGEFVEDGCGVSQGTASKLLKVYKHYVLEGGVSQRNLEGVDSEKLYLAISLKGTPEEKLEKARALSRTELKLERNDEEPCLHENLITICSNCRLRIEK